MITISAAGMLKELPRRFHTCEQRSDEWLAIRLGKLTGTNAKGIMTRGKGEDFGATAISEALEIASERACKSTPTFDAPALKWGRDWESEARAAYRCFYWPVTEVGFCSLDGFQIGCSPDGMVALPNSPRKPYTTGEPTTGIIEVKCPATRVPHMRCLFTREIPAEYLPQIQHNLLVTGADWCDFVSFHPDFPPSMRMWAKRVTWAEFDSRAAGNPFTMGEYFDRLLRFEEIVKGMLP